MQAAWRRHEYYVIATSTLTMKLAEVALQQQEALLARCKGKVRTNWHGVWTTAWLLACWTQFRVADAWSDVWRLAQHSRSCAVAQCTLRSISGSQSLRNVFSGSVCSETLHKRNCSLLQARHGYEMVRKWVDGSEGLLSLHPVEATALAFVRCAPSTASCHDACRRGVCRFCGGSRSSSGPYFADQHQELTAHLSLVTS